MPRKKTLMDRYETAKTYLKASLGKDPLAYNTTVYPIWLSDSDIFCYRRDSISGVEFRVIDPETGSNEIAFDHRALASALAKASGHGVAPDRLPIVLIECMPACASLVFHAFRSTWRYDAIKEVCTEIEEIDDTVTSPDAGKTAFLRDHNLWIRDNQTGEEWELTSDGSERLAYGAVSRAWGHANIKETPQILWSPNSDLVFTIIRDTREVERLPVMHYLPDDGVRPKVSTVPVAYPEDLHRETLIVAVIDVATGERRDPGGLSVGATRNGFGFFDQMLGWWSRDGAFVFYVDVDRFYKTVRVIMVDLRNGVCNTILEEQSETHLNLMLNQDEISQFLPLADTNELIWFSERTGWGHYYLYDLDTGQLKCALTAGNWIARRIVRFVPQTRELFLQAAGRHANRDPYYRELLRVNIDSGETVTVASFDGDFNALPAGGDLAATVFHALSGYDPTKNSCAHISSYCGVSPSGSYAVGTLSRADTVPTTFVLDRHGRAVMDIEEADIQQLSKDWIWPEPVDALAADNVTKVYGLLYKPPGFDPNKRFSVILQTFCQPETPIVPKGSFTNGHLAAFWFYQGLALAELGFVVLQLDGRGSPLRDKAFFDHCYGQMECASDISDQVHAVKELAKCRPFMDLNRVGLDAHASGGSGIWGMFKHPEFFKAGVAAMLHDQDNISAAMQGDKYNGAVSEDSKMTTVSSLADALEGNLLLLVALLDTTSAPAASFRLAKALERANKRFDMYVDPTLGHGISHEFTRRTWDFFVTHLLGETPPRDFDLSINWVD